MCKGSNKFLIRCEEQDAYSGIIKNANKILLGKFEGKKPILKLRRRQNNIKMAVKDMYMSL
jgi:hypothetical protein